MFYQELKKLDSFAADLSQYLNPLPFGSNLNVSGTVVLGSNFIVIVSNHHKNHKLVISRVNEDLSMERIKPFFKKEDLNEIVYYFSVKRRGSKEQFYSEATEINFDFLNCNIFVTNNIKNYEREIRFSNDIIPAYEYWKHISMLEDDKKKLIPVVAPIMSMNKTYIVGGSSFVLIEDVDFSDFHVESHSLSTRNMLQIEQNVVLPKWGSGLNYFNNAVVLPKKFDVYIPSGKDLLIYFEHYSKNITKEMIVTTSEFITFNQYLLSGSLISSDVPNSVYISENQTRISLVQDDEFYVLMKGKGYSDLYNSEIYKLASKTGSYFVEGYVSIVPHDFLYNAMVHY